MYHEATIANLFEVLTYYETACVALGDAVLDLVDWCVRKITFLISKAYGRPATAAPASTEEALKAGLSESVQDSLSRQLADLRFGVGVVAVTILRYITEHVTKLPLGVMTRLLDTHGNWIWLHRYQFVFKRSWMPYPADALLLLVPLIENPPWTRRNKAKQWEKFIEQKWQEVLSARQFLP
jgi:zinc finger MYND domain-containing protein 10